MIPRWPAPTAVVAALTLAFAFALPAAAQTGPSEDGLPACEPAAPGASDCLLPGWPREGAALLPSLFGEIEPGLGVWVEGIAEEAPPGGLGVRAVGVTRVRVEDAAAVGDSPELLRKGGKRKAVPSGEGVLVRIVLDRPLDALDTAHAGVFVATDVDGVRSNNAPVGVAEPDGPFADFQHVFSVNAAPGRDGLAALHTDLSKRRWYRGSATFAAARPAPEVIDMLIAPQSFGDHLRVVTYVDAEDGGYVVTGLGPVRSPIPLDGRVGRLPSCVEGSISNEAFTVRRLVENGQAFRSIQTPRSWLGGATFRLSEDERRAIDGLIAAAEPPAPATHDGLEVPADVVLVDQGLNVRQVPLLELRRVGDEAYLGFQLGLARRGYHVLRDIEPESTGDATVDAFLGRATDALVAAMPPIRSTNQAGALLGGGAGSCLPSSDPAGST
ncbi:hypothetical protein BH23CHL8_BH23CHL8_19330 [soil metagenome]